MAEIECCSSGEIKRSIKEFNSSLKITQVGYRNFNEVIKSFKQDIYELEKKDCKIFDRKNIHWLEHQFSGNECLYYFKISCKGKSWM